MGYVKDRWKEPGRRGKNPEARYRIWVTVEGKAQYGGAFRTQGMAKKHLVEQEARAQRGAWVDTSNTITTAELVRSHVQTRIHRSRTANRAESDIRNHLESHPLGAKRAVAVRPSEAQAWVTDRSKVLAPLTVRNLVGLVRGAFAAAVHDRIVASNPFDRLTLPRVERERIVPLTIQDVENVVAEIGPRYRAVVITQAGLGLRVGELLALRVQDVNFLGRTVRVQDQIDRDTRERVPPKTSRSRRTLPLPEVVSRALAAHIQEFPPAADGLLFHTRDGLPLAHDWYANKVFAPAAVKAGLPVGTNTHALRHHFASTLLAAGQSVIAVAELLGHENATLVLTTYGHLVPGGEDLARKAIDAAWNAPSDGPENSATAQGRPQ